MKKISIILASLAAALIFASCAPVTSYSTTSEEEAINAFAVAIGDTVEIKVSNETSYKGSFSGKLTAILPKEVTVTSVDGTDAGKTVSIKSEGDTVYSVTTTEAVAKGGTITLKRTDDFAGVTLLEAYTATGGEVEVTVE